MSTATKTTAVTHEHLVAVLDTVRELSSLTLGMLRALDERTGAFTNADRPLAAWFNRKGVAQSYQAIAQHDTMFESHTRQLGANMRDFDQLNAKLVQLVQRLEANVKTQEKAA